VTSCFSPFENLVIFADYTKEDSRMTLEDILKLEAKNENQKLEQKLKDSKRKNKTDTMVFCTNLIAQQITLNILAKAT
jgi:hypothetical protein